MAVVEVINVIIFTEWFSIKFMKDIVRFFPFQMALTSALTSSHAKQFSC